MSFGELRCFSLWPGQNFDLNHIWSWFPKRWALQYAVSNASVCLINYIHMLERHNNHHYNVPNAVGCQEVRIFKSLVLYVCVSHICKYIKRATSGFTLSSYNQVLRQHYSVSRAAGRQRGLLCHSPARWSAPSPTLVSNTPRTPEVPLLCPRSQCSVLEQHSPRA